MQKNLSLCWCHQHCRWKDCDATKMLWKNKSWYHKKFFHFFI